VRSGDLQGGWKDPTAAGGRQCPRFSAVVVATPEFAGNIEVATTTVTQQDLAETNGDYVAPGYEDLETPFDDQ
jgi:hypothetical protein